MILRSGRLALVAIILTLVIASSLWHSSPRKTLLRTSLQAYEHSSVSSILGATKQVFAQGSSFAGDAVIEDSKVHEEFKSESTEENQVTEESKITDKPKITEEPKTIKESKIPTEPSPYAYVFYATQNEYACSVLVNIHRLQNQLRTRHRIFVLATNALSQEYIEAFESRNVTVSIQTPPPLANGGAGYYRDCLLKLLAFKMHHIDPTLQRVLMLDSDQLVLKNMDDLFEDLPDVDLASPRAYWINKSALSSTFMMISLSDRLWDTVNDAIANITTDKYDMDLMNDLLGETVLMLPGHYITLNSHWETWGIPQWYRPQGSLSDASKNATKRNTMTPESVPRHISLGPRLAAGLDEDSMQENIIQATSDLTRLGKRKPPGSVPPPPSTAELALRPHYKELFDVYESATVVHFFALGKPWTYTLDMVKANRPEAHPIFLQQFREWRETAHHVCPTGIVAQV